MPVVVLGLAFGAPAAFGSSAQQQPLSTCLWEGPISTNRLTTRGFDGRNFNFPEESATYWLARFKLPAGSRLTVAGRYPHGRYMSLNAYSDGAPTDALSDVGIKPRPGSVNPFVFNARRDLPNRSWRVRVVDQAPPADRADRAPNTLYAKPAAGASIELLYRVYEPDRGFDLTGGTGLPGPELTLAGGAVKRGPAACAEINDPDRSIPVQTTPAAAWRSARASPGCDPATNPAYRPPRWERFFNINYASLAVISDCTAAGRQERLAMKPKVEGGFYSNRDSAYIYSHLSRVFGRVLVLTGRLPRTMQTYHSPQRMPGGQLRFWSLCTGESRVTVRTPDCLSDRQVLASSGTEFTVAVSTRADRPANATAQCGVSWLDWGDRGDGAGDPNYGLVILRNMLPSPTFSHAIQRVWTPGTEREVMGWHFPKSSYTSRSAFEARGCPATAG